MIGLPIDLQNIVQSMLPGRERIEMWMVQNKITGRGSHDAVITELLRRYITHTEVLDPSLHVVRISTSKTLGMDIPDGVESVARAMDRVRSRQLVDEPPFIENSSLCRSVECDNDRLQLDARMFRTGVCEFQWTIESDDGQ